MAFYIFTAYGSGGSAHAHCEIYYHTKSISIYAHTIQPTVIKCGMVTFEEKHIFRVSAMPHPKFFGTSYICPHPTNSSQILQ